MAFEQGPFKKLVGHTAGGDLSASQYRFVKLAANKTVVVCTAATDKPIGVLQNTPTVGQAAEVVQMGATKIVAGADLALGDKIGTANDGRAVAYVPGTATTNYIVGDVINENTAAGGIITGEINCVGAGRGA